MEPLEPLGEPNEDEDDETLEPDFYAGLKVKQRRFVEEYVIDYNGKQAAIRAGYSDNPASAAVIACRLLTNVKVSAAINILLNAKTLKTNEILAKLSLTSMSSIEPFVESIGRSLKFDFDTDEARAALPMIKKYKAGRYGPEIELHDPIKSMLAIEQIRNKVGTPDDPAKGSNKPKVLLYMPDNGRRKPPGYVPPAPLSEVKPD